MDLWQKEQPWGFYCSGSQMFAVVQDNARVWNMLFLLFMIKLCMFVGMYDCIYVVWGRLVSSCLSQEATELEKIVSWNW